MLHVPPDVLRSGTEKSLGGTWMEVPSILREKPPRAPQQLGFGCMSKREEMFFVVASTAPASDSYEASTRESFQCSRRPFKGLFGVVRNSLVYSIAALDEITDEYSGNYQADTLRQLRKEISEINDALDQMEKVRFSQKDGESSRREYEAEFATSLRNSPSPECSKRKGLSSVME